MTSGKVYTVGPFEYNRIMRENGYGKCKRVDGGGVEFDREFLLLVDIQLIG